MSELAPIDQIVIDYIADHLRGISIEAGYRTNLGLDVLTDEPEFQPESLDAGGLRTWLVDEITSRAGEYQDILTLLIRGRVYADADSSPFPRKAAREWVSDIRARMAALNAMADNYPLGLSGVAFQSSEIPERVSQSNWLYPQIIYHIEIANRAAV